MFCLLLILFTPCFLLVPRRLKHIQLLCAQSCFVEIILLWIFDDNFSIIVSVSLTLVSVCKSAKGLWSQLCDCWYVVYQPQGSFWHFWLWKVALNCSRSPDSSSVSDWFWLLRRLVAVFLLFSLGRPFFVNFDLLFSILAFQSWSFIINNPKSGMFLWFPCLFVLFLQVDMHPPSLAQPNTNLLTTTLTHNSETCKLLMY